MKVCLCFYGLNRSLQLTYNSIYDKILIPLKNNNINYDIFFYTYQMNEKDNYWTNVKETKNDNDLIVEKIVKPKYFKTISDEELRNQANNTLNYINCGRMEKERYEYLYISSYLRYKNINLLLDEIDESYDNIILMRPDVYYLTYFNINWFNECKNNTVCIPDFHHWKGLNDRLMIGKRDVIRKIFKTLFDMNKIRNHNKFAEDLLKISLQTLKIESIFIKFYLVRVRSDLTLDKTDKYELENNNKSEILCSNVDRALLLNMENKKNCVIDPENIRDCLYFNRPIISLSNKRWGTRINK